MLLLVFIIAETICNTENWLSGQKMWSKILNLLAMLTRWGEGWEFYFGFGTLIYPPLPLPKFGTSHGELWHYGDFAVYRLVSIGFFGILGAFTGACLNTDTELKMTNCELWCSRKKVPNVRASWNRKSFRLKLSLDAWFVRFEQCSRQACCRWKLQFVIAQDCNCTSQISDVIFLELCRLQIHNLWGQCSKFLQYYTKTKNNPR